MTGREGETFPGFFYGRSRAAGYGRTRGPLVAGIRRWPGNALIGSSPPSMAGRGSCQRGPAGGFVALYRRCRKGRGMHCEGPIPALPVAGLFWGGSMLLEKNANIFLCLFGMLIE